MIVDPDAWLRAVDGRAYLRKVRTNGSVLVDEVPYYIAQDLAGQYVTLRVEAATRAFVVVHHGKEIKRLAIKGLQHRLLSFDAFVDLLVQQAWTDRGTRPALACRGGPAGRRYDVRNHPWVMNGTRHDAGHWRPVCPADGRVAIVQGGLQPQPRHQRHRRMQARPVRQRGLPSAAEAAMVRPSMLGSHEPGRCC
jgi:hypothetical protein